MPASIALNIILFAIGSYLVLYRIYYGFCNKSSRFICFLIRLLSYIKFVFINIMTLFHTDAILRRFVRFCEQLSQLLQSGMPLKSALKLLTDLETNAIFHARLCAFESSLLNGENFLHGLIRLISDEIPVRFEHMACLPNLEILLQALSRYFHFKITTARALVKRLVYPCFLLTSLLILLFFFLFILFPFYYSFYRDMNIPLPRLLKILHVLHYALLKFGALFILFLGVLIAIFYTQLSHFIKQRLLSSFFSFQISDIIWIWAILLQSGIALKDCVSMIRLPETHPLYNHYQNFIAVFFQTGQFSLSCRSHLPLFTLYHLELISYSEKSGCLTQGLFAVAEDLNTRQTARINLFLSVIQPLLLAVMASLILFLFFLIYLPLFNSLQFL